MADVGGVPERGRALVAERAWADAYEALSAAETESALAAETWSGSARRRT